MFSSPLLTCALASLATIASCSSPKSTPIPSETTAAASTTSPSAKDTSSSSSPTNIVSNSSPTPTSTSSSSRGPTITLSYLLEELTDRRALARWPDPAFTCAQASSYDRASVSPDKDWFANGDAGQYIRMEEHDGRTEGVMLDADGPGAIVRIWSANPAGNLRVYIDGDAEPAIQDDMNAILSNQGPVQRPLSAETSRGHTLYARSPMQRIAGSPATSPRMSITKSTTAPMHPARA